MSHDPFNGTLYNCKGCNYEYYNSQTSEYKHIVSSLYGALLPFIKYSIKITKKKNNKRDLGYLLVPRGDSFRAFALNASKIPISLFIKYSIKITRKEKRANYDSLIIFLILLSFSSSSSFCLLLPSLIPLNSPNVYPSPKNRNITIKSTIILVNILSPLFTGLYCPSLKRQ